MYGYSKEEKERMEEQKNPKGPVKRFLFDHERVYVKQNYIEELSDRELQEKQVYYLSEIYQNSKSIKKNIQFFFYATVISTLITLIVLANMKN